MLLREVDVARFSVADLAVLGLELEGVRNALRSSATVVVGDPSDRLIARGPFGEVVLTPQRSEARHAFPMAGAGDALTTAICRELAAPVERGESPSSLWHRALQRGAARRSIRLNYVVQSERRVPRGARRDAPGDVHPLFAHGALVLK